MAQWTELQGMTVASRYELHTHLATGGMAAVYRGWDLRMRRPVAVKLLRDDAGDMGDVETSGGRPLARFRREARAVAALRSPHIVEVYDFVEDAGRTYLIMELVDGPNLKQRIHDAGPLAAEEALTHAIHVCRALAQAHAHGFIHRDIKPQNILLDPSGASKLTDFGIVHIGSGQSLTASGLVLGTADYIAPEQAQGMALGPGSDLYSLGIVLFEMLTATVPFNGTTATAVAIRHTSEPLPPLRLRNPDVPPLLDRIVQRASAKDPDLRFTSAAQMEAALTHALAVCGSTSAATLAGAARRGPYRLDAAGSSAPPGPPGDATARTTRTFDTASEPHHPDEPDEPDWHDVARLLSALPLRPDGEPLDEIDAPGSLPLTPDPNVWERPAQGGYLPLDALRLTLPRAASARLALTLGAAMLLFVALLLLRMLL